MYVALLILVFFSNIVNFVALEIYVGLLILVLLFKKVYFLESKYDISKKGTYIYVEAIHPPPHFFIKSTKLSVLPIIFWVQFIT